MSAAPIPYSRQSVTEADIAAVAAVLRSDFLTTGPALDAFERDVAQLHQVRHAVALSNATAALHLGCLAMGVGAGDLVWTSPNTFLASANCARYCGADVDFVDIDPLTRNMSVQCLAQRLAQAQRAGGRLPKVVIPVDFAGLPADLREMRELADRYGFRILEDASHAVGAWLHGQPVGSRWADATVFSFHPVKIVTTAEGGVLATQDDALAERVRLLRSHGMTRDPALMSQPSHGPWYYEQVALGFNYRMTDLQAALGSSQLSRLRQLRQRRGELAARYDEQLAALPLLLPPTPADRVSALHLYAVEIDDSRCAVTRAQAVARLREAGILVQVHYIPVHLQPYYRALGFEPGQFPNSERYYARAFSLPLFPDLQDGEQDRVVQALHQALEA